MDAPHSLHPSDRALNDYGLGRLDDGSASTVNEHLEGCADCRRRVAGLTSDSFLARFREGQDPPARSIPAGSLDGGTLSFLPGRAPSPPPPADTLPPGLADHPDYEIRRELGRGGMGVVYLAHNTLMGRDEVLKVMGRQFLERPSVLERFQREIRAVAKLRHPNIVAAYSAFRIEGGLVFAMEHVEGLDLSRLVRTKGPLSVAHAAYFVHQAALGLQHAHERGMIHRDIKPHNLMVTSEGKARVVKVLDFGLAKASREQKVNGGLTSEGQALGTPDYIAPEQITSAVDVDIRADLYGLGGTLFYLLTGRPPFQGNTLYDIYQAHISRDAEPLNLIRPEVPAELAALVAKLMAKEPKRRFQTPAEVAQALTPFFKSKVVKVQTETSQAGPTETKPLKLVQKPEPTELATNAPGPVIRGTNSVVASNLRRERPINLEERELIVEPLTKDKPGRPRWYWHAISAAALLSVLFIASLPGIIIKLKTEDGVIVLENVPNDARILVDGKKITFTWPGDERPVEIRSRPGEHELEVEKDGFKTFGTKVSFEATKSAVVTVRLEAMGEAQAKTRVSRPAEVKTDGISGPDSGVRNRSAPPALRGLEAVSTSTSGRGMRPLFNGTDLSGWKTDSAEPGDWRVENGILIGTGKGVSHLYTIRRDFRDFRLRIEARFNSGGTRAFSSIRNLQTSCPRTTPITPKVMRRQSTAIEAPRKIPEGSTKAIRAENGFEKPAKIPPGQWFTMDILSSNDDLEIVVDGQRCCTMSGMVRYAKGQIGLRIGSPGTVVEFRSINVKEYDTREKPSGSEIVRLVGHNNRVLTAAFSPDGRRLVTGGDALHVWHNGGSTSRHWGDNTVRLWDLPSGRNLWTAHGHDPQVRSTVFSPDGALVASCGGWEGPPFQGVILSDAETGREIHTLDRKANAEKLDAKVVAFSIDGSSLMELFPNGAIRSWDLGTKDEHSPLRLNAGRIKADEFPVLLLTPDRRRLVTGSKNGRVEVWDRTTGNRLKTFGDHAGAITTLSCSGDGRLILSGGTDNVARLWEADSGRLLQLLDCKEEGLRCAAISPDGNLALTGGHYGPIGIWDLRSGKEIGRFEGHTLGINCLAFSPDGSRAASGSEDRTARIWKVEARQDVGKASGTSIQQR